MAAPGGDALLTCERDIISTVPTDAEEGFCEASVGTPDHDFYAGTSMATPHVAGVAALLRSTGLDADATLDCLKSTARTPVLGLRGVNDPLYGYGIVDATEAVTVCGGDEVPGTPDGAKGGGKGGGGEKGEDHLGQGRQR